jgi:hypothetical protein
MRDVVGVIFLVDGDGHLGPSESHRGGEGVDDIHLLLGDAALPAGLIRLEAPKDHEAVLGLEELIILLLGAVNWVIGLGGMLLGLCPVGQGCYRCSPSW